MAPTDKNIHNVGKFLMTNDSQTNWSSSEMYQVLLQGLFTKMEVSVTNEQLKHHHVRSGVVLIDGNVPC